MRHPVLRTLSPVAATLALTAACIGDGAADRSLPDLDTVTTVEAVIPDPALAGVGGRLLVLGTQNVISTMRPDGTDRVTLATADPDVERRTQPTWSPDGSQVVWTERTTDQTDNLILANTDGTTESSTRSPLLAGYIAWDPMGNRFAMSGNDSDGNLVLATTEPGNDIDVIDEGAPLYFDWAPDSRSLLVHISERFEYVTVDGSQRTPVAADGEFRLGAHLGDALILGTERDIGEVLAVADQNGSVLRELVRFAAPMAYVIHPRQDRVAAMSKGSPESQRLARVEASDLPILEPNRLSVIDTTTGSIDEVVRARGVAWFWSPNGDRLLYSTLEVLDGVERLQWHTWDGTRSISYATFTPTGIFARDYLAFFDQFARSLSLWSPDGSAFAYAGGSSLEDVGIWVQPVDGGDPIRVSAGEAVVWSPA